MYSRKTALVWIGIAALSGMFLLGQEPWPTCQDGDADGYGDPADPSCTYAELDCDDGNADVYPDAAETCDGIDNQCPGDEGYGVVDEGCGPGPMVEIPSGCYDMGDPFNEGDPWELPVHNVCISGFEMDVHEVTNAEYAGCVDMGVCTPPAYAVSHTRSSYYGNPAYDDFPVIWIDRYQAETYCNWAGRRLPTEAEWEYAARGGLPGHRYPWGDTIIAANANYMYSGDPWDNDTSEVEFYAPNGYGLYDVAGNVYEWVNDGYEEDYYSVSPQNDPPGPASGDWPIARGGAWGFLTDTLRVSARKTGMTPDWLDPSFGFRCARGGAYGP